jgi:hypothetical protein
LLTCLLVGSKKTTTGEKSTDGSTVRKVDAEVTPFAVVDVTHMGKIVAEETMRTQREIGEYQRRVKQFEVINLSLRCCHLRSFSSVPN